MALIVLLLVTAAAGRPAGVNERTEIQDQTYATTKGPWWSCLGSAG